MVDVRVTPAMIRAKARAAFDRGESEDSHGFNPGASAIFDFVEEHQRLAAKTHHAARTGSRVDAAQASPC